jgi:hypothetical protein
VFYCKKIHLEQGDALDDFEGDPSPFEPARYHLASCLQARYEKKEKKISLVLGFLGLSAIVLFGLWIFVAIRDHQRWTAYLQQLKAELGIVVTEAFDEGGIYRVSGLRDPMAKKPMAILATTELDPHAVVHHFQPYQALFEVLINKADLTDEWSIDMDTIERLVGRGWTVLETSSKTGQGVEDAFRSLATAMLER